MALFPLLGEPPPRPLAVWPHNGTQIPMLTGVQQTVTDRVDRSLAPWAKAWRILVSDRLLILWLGFFALAGLLILWFPQAPRSAYLQEGGVERWLTTVRPQLGAPASTLMALGVLTVAQAGWFRVILAGIGLTLLLRTFDALQQLGNPTAAFWPAASHSCSIESEPLAALDVVQAVLDRHFRRNQRRYRDAEPHPRLIAFRPLAPVGTLCVAVGGLVVMAGWLWTQAAGWELANLRLTEGSPITVPLIEQTLRLEAFQVDWGDEETQVSALARLALWDEELVASGEVDLHEGWRWQGVNYRLTAVGPAVTVSGEGADEQPLMLQTAAHRPPVREVTLLLPPEDGPRSFAAPDEGIVIQVEAEPFISSPRIGLRAYQGREGELVEDQTINEAATLALNGARFFFDILPYAEITASHTPGRALMITGCVILLTGILLTLAGAGRPGRLEVIAVGRDGVTELTLNAPDHTGSAWLRNLTGQLDSERREANVADKDGAVNGDRESKAD